MLAPCGASTVLVTAAGDEDLMRHVNLSALRLITLPDLHFCGRFQRSWWLAPDLLSHALMTQRATPIGITILSIWCVLNLLPGLGSVAFIALGHHAPALRYLIPVGEIATLDPRALAAIDGIALIANTLIAVHCALALMVVRRALARGERWALVVLVAGFATLQLASYLSDRVYFGGKNAIAVHASSVILVLGLGMCVRGLSERRGSAA